MKYEVRECYRIMHLTSYILLLTSFFLTNHKIPKSQNQQLAFCLNYTSDCLIVVTAAVAGCYTFADTKCNLCLQRKYGL